MADKKLKRFKFTLTDQEKKLLQTQARLQGFTSLSGFIRHRLGLKELDGVTNNKLVK